MEWYLLPIISAPMPFQMGLDEVLYRPQEYNLADFFPDIESRPILRIYYSSEPWITLGYSMTEPVSNPAIPFCRRITGGGEVLHGRDTLITLIGNKNQDESFHSVRVSYWKIHEAIKFGLQESGYPAQFYRCDQEYPKGNECFVYPISSDLSLRGKKIAGGAQKRSGGRFLHQESIQLQCASKMIERSLIHGFEEIFNVRFISWPLHPDLLKLASEAESRNYHNHEGVKML